VELSFPYLQFHVAAGGSHLFGYPDGVVVEAFALAHQHQWWRQVVGGGKGQSC
jgi:hypothetical protein